jgi:hypothetical protein
MRRPWAGLAGLALALASSLSGAGVAAADPLDEFGFGTDAAGMASARTAIATGAEAAHHNPGGVAIGRDPSVMLGYGYGSMHLDIDGRDSQVLDIRGTSLGIAVPIPITDSISLGLGMALYLPDQFVARIQLIPPTEPHFILLDNDPHRLVAEPVVALRLGEWLTVGGGASVLGDARGNGITFNVGIVSGEKVGEAQLDAALPIRLAPLIGVQVAPGKRLRGGLTYRGQLGLDLALDILANVDVAGVVTGDALVSIRADSYFTPARVTAGVAADPLPELTLSAEAVWAQWSAYGSGLAELQVLVALDITPPLVQTEFPASGFQDTVTLRGGAEYRGGAPTDRLRWALRGGYAFMPTPVPAQRGLTSFADNDRHVFALGGTLTLNDLRPFLTRPIDLGIAAQWHHLVPELTVKDASDFPGAAFSSRGDILHMGASATVRF